MTWAPYRIEDVEELLIEEQVDFGMDERAKFSRTNVPIAKVSCFRSNQYPDDALFVIATDGETAVIFDDVDEEFGICESKAIGDGDVHKWTLVGSLSAALTHLK
jgi:hypothetical protein